jgi:hypothetical protein
MVKELKFYSVAKEWRKGALLTNRLLHSRWDKGLQMEDWNEGERD